MQGPVSKDVRGALEEGAFSGRQSADKRRTPQEKRPEARHHGDPLGLLGKRGVVALLLGHSPNRDYGLVGTDDLGAFCQVLLRGAAQKKYFVRSLALECVVSAIAIFVRVRGEEREGRGEEREGRGARGAGGAGRVG